MSKEMEFFIFLLEQYSYARNLKADVVLKKWDEAGITNTIYNMYDLENGAEIFLQKNLG